VGLPFGNQVVTGTTRLHAAGRSRKSRRWGSLQHTVDHHIGVAGAHVGVLERFR
jgi:hypothetical protein